MFIPAVIPNQASATDIPTEDGALISQHGLDILYHNTIPVQTKDGEWSLTTRPTFEQASGGGFSGLRGLGVCLWRGLNVAVSRGVHTASNFDVRISGVNFDVGASTLADDQKCSFCSFYDSGDSTLIIHLPGKPPAGSQDGATFYSTTGAAVTEITDSNMPGNGSTTASSGVVFLDGYLFLGNFDGQIHNSNLNDYTTWGASDFISVEREADKLIHIAKQNDHIVAFGGQTIEFFYNPGNATGSPLSRRQDMALNIGSAEYSYIADSEGVIYFIGQEPTGGRHLYRMENLQVTRVNSPAMSRLLAESGLVLNTGEDALASGRGSGTVINLPNSGDVYVFTVSNGTVQGTYACHIETGIVSKWYVGSEPTDGGIWDGNWVDYQVLPLVDSNSIGATNQTALANPGQVIFANGYVARYGPAGTGDLIDGTGTGTAAPAFFYTQPLDFETVKRKRMNSLSVLHYPNVDDSADPSDFEVDWYDTDVLLASGMTDATMFTGGETVDLSTFWNKITRMGQFDQRIFKGIFTPDKRQVVRGFEATVTVLND